MNLHAFIFDFLLDVHHLIFLSLGLLAGTKIGRKLEQRKALRATVALSATPTISSCSTSAISRSLPMDSGARAFYAWAVPG
jgi:hypothetical protein